MAIATGHESSFNSVLHQVWRKEGLDAGWRTSELNSKTQYSVRYHYSESYDEVFATRFLPRFKACAAHYPDIVLEEAFTPTVDKLYKEWCALQEQIKFEQESEKILAILSKENF